MLRLAERGALRGVQILRDRLRLRRPQILGEQNDRHLDVERGALVVGHLGEEGQPAKARDHAGFLPGGEFHAWRIAETSGAT